MIYYIIIIFSIFILCVYINIMDMHDKINNFNMDQIIPIFLKLKKGHEIIQKIILYMSQLEIFLSNINPNINNIFDKKLINENMLFTFNQIKSIYYSQHHSQKIISQKNSIFEQLGYGVCYKYKLNNNIICENPNKLKINNIIINDKTQIIINDFIFDFIINDNEQIKKKYINLIINNIYIFISHLEIILSQFEIYIHIIESDVKYFSLFNEKYLYI
jgi:hypothetical protein